MITLTRNEQQQHLADAKYWLFVALEYRGRNQRRKMRRAAMLMRADLALLSGDYSREMMCLARARECGLFSDGLFNP